MKKRAYLALCFLPLFFNCTLQAENKVKIAKSFNTVYDYEYQKNRYFFVSHHYRDQFESGLTRDLLHFSLDAWTQIMELDVWVSASSSDPSAIPGIAMTDLESDANMKDIDASEKNTAIVHKGHFKPLDPDAYGFNGDRGYFWLNEPVSDPTVLAISYVRKDKKKIGTRKNLVKSPDRVVLSLIKPENQIPSEKFAATWPLMMKNIYFLGTGLEAIKNLNIIITDGSHIINEAGLEENNSFLNMLGLDKIDECRYYMRDGDGILDYNSFNLDLKSGVLVFPGVHPFNPEPDSSFQLDGVNPADIYNTVSPEVLKTRSKFKITVIDMMQPEPETALNTANQSVNQEL